MKKVTAWDLFEKIFKQGDEVVVITDYDRFHWGKLSYNFTNCTLKRPNKEEVIPWHNVRFISHDGFPIKRLTGADGSKLIEKINTADVQATIKNALVFSLCKDCGKLTENIYRCDSCQKIADKVRSMRVGDPFDIEGVYPVLLKEGIWGLSGNNSEAECLHLVAPNGAIGQLFDLPSIYMFE